MTEAGMMVRTKVAELGWARFREWLNPECLEAAVSRGASVRLAHARRIGEGWVGNKLEHPDWIWITKTTKFPIEPELAMNNGMQAMRAEKGFSRIADRPLYRGLTFFKAFIDVS